MIVEALKARDATKEEFAILLSDLIDKNVLSAGRAACCAITTSASDLDIAPRRVSLAPGDVGDGSGRGCRLRWHLLGPGVAATAQGPRSIGSSIGPEIAP